MRPGSATDPGALSSASAIAPDHPGQGVVHHDGSRFRLRDSAAPCGATACGNEREDSCTVWPESFQSRPLAWSSEDCDGDADGLTCEDLGYAAGELRCSSTCTWDLSGCEVCPDEHCVPHPPPTTAPATLVSMAIATDGQRVRMVWTTARGCLYTSWADQAGSEVLACGPDIEHIGPLELEAQGDGFSVTASDGSSRRWSGRIDALGALVDVETTPAEPTAPFSGKFDDIDLPGWQPKPGFEMPAFGALYLHAVRPDPSTPHVPLVVRWSHYNGPVGDPIRIANDPRGVAHLGPGVALADRFVVAWWSPTRGAFSTTLPLPATDE